MDCVTAIEDHESRYHLGAIERTDQADVCRKAPVEQLDFFEAVCGLHIMSFRENLREERPALRPIRAFANLQTRLARLAQSTNATTTERQPARQSDRGRGIDTD